MPRPSQPARNVTIAIELFNDKRPAKELAVKYGLSESQVYRAAKVGQAQIIPTGRRENFATSRPGGALMSELSTPGLRRAGGSVIEEYDRVFRTLYRRIQIYKEMGDDPIVAAVLQAVKMTIRRIGWYVETDGKTEADKKAAGFLETCLDDMSQTWSDTIDQALDMMQYGFQLAELVYKRRQGRAEEAGSKYDDGLIGWRKWIFIAPDSLAPGNEWVWDEEGGLQAFNQQDIYATPARNVTVPIDKAILFRTTAARSNPEGRAILRAMYRPWYYKSNLEEVEAISAERMGAGLPVVYVGDDVDKGADGDYAELQNIATNIRIDEQAGITIPYSKMGSGAPEGKGVLLELLSPPGKGAVDFNQTITRHEQRMAMVGLAQFIHLGMNQVGAKSLGESSQDFFTLAVSGWVDGLCDTINRYGVDRLINLNDFPGLTATPYIAHDSVGGTNLLQMADYINKLAGAQLITPSLELEKNVRELADLPTADLDEAYREKEEKAERTEEITARQLEQARKANAPQAPAPGDEETGNIEPDEDEPEEEDEMKSKRHAEEFALLRQAITLLERDADNERREQFNATLLAAVSKSQAPAVVVQSATMNMPENFAMPDPVAPIVQVHVPPQAPPVVNVAAPNVTVQIPEQPAPIINVAAPVVNVPPQAPPVISIPPARVTAVVEMPETEETIEIERDGDGNMKRARKTRRKKSN